MQLTLCEFTGLIEKNTLTAASSPSTGFHEKHTPCFQPTLHKGEGMFFKVFFVPKWVQICTQIDRPTRAWVQKVPGGDSWVQKCVRSDTSLSD